MTDRLARFEERLEAVERRLDRIEQRSQSARARQPEQPEQSGGRILGEDSLPNAATHLGRVLLIFGGAYLLRAITDFGFLPTLAGIPIGLAYALFWLFLAYSHGVREDRATEAMLYGCVSVLLVLPILVEAVTRFELLTGSQGAAALVAFSALSLAVAVLRNLRSIAWLTTTGGIATALLLLRASQSAVTFTIVLLILGLVSLWIVYLRPWRGLQWAGALGANTGVVLLALLAAHDNWAVNSSYSYILALVAWAAYIASFVARALFQERSPGVFEIVQTLVASGILFGVALLAAHSASGYAMLIGATTAAAGIAAYALALFPAKGDRSDTRFYFFSNAGLLLVAGGTALLLGLSAASIVWSLMAAALAWLSGRLGRVTLSLQSAILIIAAGAASGALATGVQAFTGGAESWPATNLPQLLAAAAAVFSLFVPVAQHSERWGAAAGLPQLIVLILSIWIVGGLMLALTAPLFTGVPGESADLGLLAALRTGVLAAAAVVLAFTSRYPRWPEARWLAYPVLATTGLKLIAEDFPHGRPVTLFIALALVGCALILVARLLPRRGAASAKAPA